MKLTLIVAEAAKLGISTVSVYMLVRHGRTPYVRVGRLVRFRRDRWMIGFEVPKSTFNSVVRDDFDGGSTLFTQSNEGKERSVLPHDAE